MQIVKLNLIPGGVLPVCFASQHDTGRVIRFMLYEGENVFTLSGDESIALRLQKPDGSELVESVTNTGADYVDVVTTADTCDTAGASVGEIAITDGGDVLGSANFGLFVESDAFEGGGIVTQTATGAIATFETNIETAFVSLKSDINPVQSGSGTPSPQNVRPISGFSALNVTRTGVNLFDNSLMVNSQTTVVGDTVTLTATGNFQGSAFAYMPVKQGYKYALNIDSLTSGSGVEIRRYNASGTVTNTIVITQSTIINIADGTTVKISIVYGNRTAGAGTFVLKGFNIALGEDYQAYTPYNGQTATVNFGQTVFGGSLNVTTGLLTLTHGYYQITGTENWAWAKSSSYSGGFYTPVASVGAKVGRPFICTHAKSASTISEYEWGTCYCDGSLNFRIMQANDTVQDWKNYLASQYSNGTPVSICYELATPIEITTTPENLTAIVGVNNVYSDTNGDTTVEYYIEV